MPLSFRATGLRATLPLYIFVVSLCISTTASAAGIVSNKSNRTGTATNKSNSAGAVANKPTSTGAMAAKLNGTWTVDADAMIARDSKLPPQKTEALRQLEKNMRAVFDIKQKTFTILINGEVREKNTILSMDELENTILLKFEKKSDYYTFRNDDSITVGENSETILKRVQ